MELDIAQNLTNKTNENDTVNKFIEELNGAIKNEDNLNIVDKSEKYMDYWDYQNFMEDNVSATIGLSRWDNDITYSNELQKAVEESILELSEREGPLYRKQFSSHGSSEGPRYSVDKFENGKIEHLVLPPDKVPGIFENEDIIFQYKDDGRTKIRMDFKEEAIEMACQKTTELKFKSDEIAKDFKREGHIYEAFEDDGYIFLNDLTEERDFSIEDIDFVVDCYQGDGTYQVIDGEYRKIED